MAITRHFIDWNKPALTVAADYLIGRYANGDQLDMSKVILVFPGRRAARRMLELLVLRAGTKWPAMIPPRMVTFNRLPEMLYVQKLQLADELTQLLVWRKALYAVPAREIRSALPDRPHEDSVPAWMALCESLRRQHNELAAEGLEFDEVHQKLSQSGDIEEAERWKALRRLQSEYLVQMDELKLWDRQAARLIAVEQHECHTDSDIILIGTVDMNRIIRQMLDQVSDRVTALIHAPEADKDYFDEYGCVVCDAWQNRPLNVGLEITRITGTPIEQARAAMQELASYGGVYRADDITIGVADDTMVPTLLQTMSDAGISGHWPVGMHVRETRPYRLLQAIALHVASARDELPADFATLSDLVRHPDVNSWISDYLAASLTDDAAFAAREMWLSELDEYIAEHLQVAPGELLGKPPRRILVAEVCRAVEFLSRCLVADAYAAEFAGSAVGRLRPQKAAPRKSRQRTLDEMTDVLESSLSHKLEERRPLSEWAEGAVRVLATIYGERELQSDSAADRGIVECVTKLQDLNEQLQRIPRDVLPLCTASQSLQLLLKQIADEIIPPEPDDAAVELLGWLELTLDDSPVLILTGFNEGKVPESMNCDAFMPNSLRTRLDLTDNRRRYARDAYALMSILHSRRKVVLVKGRTDVQGNPLAPSRLWFAADPSSIPERVRRFYDPDYSAEEGAENQAQETGSIAAPAPIPRLSGFVVPPPVDVPAAPVEIPVTAFREYIQCPYRYFLRRELRLRADDDDVRELTAPVFGSLMHDVLKSFGESAVSQAVNVEAIETFLLQELHREALGRFGRSRSATVSVQLKMLESRLSAFARWQVESLRDGWKIFYTEQDLMCDDFTDIHDRPVKLIGRVDRIDRRESTGEWRVLDYKTSETAEPPNRTHRRNDEWIDLQLPLYRLLVKSLKIKGDIQLGYIQLPGDLSKVGYEPATWNDNELLDAEKLARTVAADIIDLKIDRVTPMNDQRYAELSRICQDPVIDRNIPWLQSWPGRRSSVESDLS
jgi:ATP-dependent helicase/nuclease subunit B